jgi:hypothetical protein
MFRTQFVVSGKGTFPVDMLRYDTCFPDTESESGLLLERKSREIVLACYHPDKKPRLTAGRWASFGWTLVNEVVTRKV